MHDLKLFFGYMTLCLYMKNLKKICHFAKIEWCVQSCKSFLRFHSILRFKLQKVTDLYGSNLDCPYFSAI